MDDALRFKRSVWRTVVQHDELLKSGANSNIHHTSHGTIRSSHSASFIDQNHGTHVVDTDVVQQRKVVDQCAHDRGK